MRRKLLTLALTASALVSTDATHTGTSATDSNSDLLPRRDSDLTSRSEYLGRRVWTTERRHGGFEYILGVKTPFQGRKKHKRGSGHGGDDSDDDSDDDDYDHDGDGELCARGGGECPHGKGNPKQNHFPQKGPWPPTTSDHPPSPTMSPTASSSTAMSAASSTTPVDVSKSPGTSTVPSPTSTHAPSKEEDNDQDPLIAGLAGGLGGALLILLAILATCLLVIRRRRRECLGGRHAVPSKESDLESRVTLAMTERAVIGSAARGLPILPPAGAAFAEPPPPHPRRAPAASSACASCTSLIDPYAAVYGNSHTSLPHAYSPLAGAHQEYGPSVPLPPLPSLPPLPPSSRRTHGPDGVSRTDELCSVAGRELGGRTPPPQYPDAVAMSAAATRVPGPSLGSPVSPIPVSPLSEASVHGDSRSMTAIGQLQAPLRRPSYDYAYPVVPEVVSPICQLGQTSASSPEYDESVEAALSGGNGHHNFGSNHHPHHQQGDEKQPMSRY